MSQDKADVIEMLLETCLKQRRQIKDLEEGKRLREQFKISKGVEKGYQHVSESFEIDVELAEIALQPLRQPEGAKPLTLMQALQAAKYSQQNFISASDPKAVITVGSEYLIVQIPVALDVGCDELQRWRVDALRDD